MKLVLLLKLIFGFLALALAAIGLILPVWPTTPFVLVAIWCFSSMPKIKSRILRVPYFREYYESYTAGKGIRRKTVTASLIFLWAMLLLSIVLMSSVPVTIILPIVGIAVTIHIVMISKDRTAKRLAVVGGNDEK